MMLSPGTIRCTVRGRVRSSVAGKTLASLAFLSVGGLVAAACGSSSPPGAIQSPSPTGAGSKSTTPSSGAVVKAEANPTLGSILVDSGGMTLYTLTSNNKSLPCNQACLRIWPALTLPSGATPTGPGSVGVLGVTTQNGISQVTDNGRPLYRFAADQAPGDTKGDGILSFGGTWHVISLNSATSSTSTAPTSAPPPASSGGGGYGY
ncbi:MAG: COG4315 family predicted lipoprotein [Acidimicrobiales bacterium]